MKTILSALILSFLATLSFGDEVFDSECFAPVFSPARLNDTNQSCGATGESMRIESFNVPVAAEKYSIEEMSELSYKIFIFTTHLSRKIQTRMCQIRDIYSPKVEKVNMGDLVFDVKLSYGFNVSSKKVNATLTFNDIKKRRK
jgi:hypothetical protein